MSEQDFSQYLASLDSSKFRQLWPAQEYILNRYSGDYVAKKDVSIELPTGVGRTLIALLIASTWLADGRKAVILSVIANEHYRDTAQVLYMSATVGDPGDLARRLGVRPVDKIPIPPRVRRQDVGAAAHHHEPHERRVRHTRANGKGAVGGEDSWVPDGALIAEWAAGGQE